MFARVHVFHLRIRYACNSVLTTGLASAGRNAFHIAVTSSMDTKTTKILMTPFKHFLSPGWVLFIACHSPL